MKSIPNKPTTINVIDNTGKSLGTMDYADLISRCIGMGKQGGFDYNDITNRVEIGKAVKAAKAKTGESADVVHEIEIENAPFEYLREIVKVMRWDFFSEDLLAFKEEILAIK